MCSINRRRRGVASSDSADSGRSQPGGGMASASVKGATVGATGAALLRWNNLSMKTPVARWGGLFRVEPLPLPPFPSPLWPFETFCIGSLPGSGQHQCGNRSSRFRQHPHSGVALFLGATRQCPGGGRSLVRTGPGARVAKGVVSATCVDGGRRWPSGFFSINRASSNWRLRAASDAHRVLPGAVRCRQKRGCRKEKLSFLHETVISVVIWNQD